MKLGLCERCGQPTDACYEIRNNQVYLVKFCKDCGRTASLVTKDARKWRWKRDITDYKDPAISGCDLNCKACDHQLHKKPNTVAIDVTNHCNQHCPICLAYVDAMGFSYSPPVEYFEKIFKHFQDQNPRPNMCFFGGEPTVHPDFLSIVRMAKDYGFQVQVFTNGLKLADKEYCKELCGLGIQVNFGFDGTQREIYQVLRGDNSLAAKKKAFENVIECGVNKLAVITTVANGVNDGDMRNLLEFIHQFRDHVSVWGFVPLTPCWEGEVNLSPTTTECVERIFQQLVPEIEFVPTGMMNFQVLSRFFGRQTLGGSHPNCESATLLVSDGTKYSPISSYLRIPLSELLVRLRKLDKVLGVKAESLPPKGIRRFMFDVKSVAKTIRILGRSLELSRIFGDRFLWPATLAMLDILRGEKIDKIIANRTLCKNLLTLITIPYEDQGGLEDARLHDCPAVFAYEDVDSGQIRTAAFCSWQTIKDEKCRRIQAHYDDLLKHDVDEQRITASEAS